MKFSIITVTYNSEAYLEETILSIINQKGIDLEYIIIDGGSTDTTKSIIEKYRNNIHHFISEPDNGIYDALNKGIKLSTGDVIGILHSDDIYTSDSVLKKIGDTISYENTEACYANLFYVDAKNINQIKRKWKSGKHNSRSFLFGWMPPHPTFFCKKSVYDNLGSFNTRLKTSADYELMLRFMYKHKIKTSYLNEFIVKMRTGGQSNRSLRNRLLANYEDRMAWRMNDVFPLFFTLSLKPLRKILQFF
ncbi:MAG: glycosyltransferase family 2 protein [Bacteroidia bacterium]